MSIISRLTGTATLLVLGTIAIGFLGGLPASASETPPAFRVLSWNVSLDNFVDEPAAFRALLAWGDPDVVLLDEVDPRADVAALTKALAALRPGDEDRWVVSMGASGGTQRSIIATRAPRQALPEFTQILPYPDRDRRHILDLVPDDERDRVTKSLAGGIPVNGAIIHVAGRRLLVVVVDLACCGDGPESWQEARRRIEAREIRRLLRQVLARETVDGVVFAGDFNLVNSTFPMALLTGPYPAPHAALIPAEIYHPDGVTSWTWDGRGTPYPSNTLDYQFYGPVGLRQLSGVILDSEALAPDALRLHRLEADMSAKTGRHRPLLVEYGWTGPAR